MHIQHISQSSHGKPQSLYYNACCSILILCSQIIALEFNPDSATIALWHFNEQSGDTVFDAGGRSHHGRLDNSGERGLGVLGGGLDFSEIRGITVPASGDFKFSSNSSFTIEFWCIPPDSGYSRFIISNLYTDPSNNRSGYVFSIDRSNVLSFYMMPEESGAGSPTVKSPRALPNNSVWHHVAAVYDASENTLFLYIDGQQVAHRDTCFS